MTLGAPRHTPQLDRCLALWNLTDRVSPLEGYTEHLGRRSTSVPYSHNFELPPSVRSHLPPHAQDIYREAFNHAFDAHMGDPRQEEAAHRIAWAAVKRRYVKEGDKWVERG